MAKARVLAVDDQRYFRELIEGLLTDEGYEVQTASSGEEALHILEREDFEIVEATPHSLIGVALSLGAEAAEESPGFSGSRVKPTRGSADELERAAFASESKLDALRIVR